MQLKRESCALIPTGACGKAIKAISGVFIKKIHLLLVAMRATLFISFMVMKLLWLKANKNLPLILQWWHLTVDYLPWFFFLFFWVMTGDLIYIEWSSNFRFFIQENCMLKAFQFKSFLTITSFFMWNQETGLILKVS